MTLKTFLSALFGDVKGYIEIRVSPPGERQPLKRWGFYRLSQVEKAIERAKRANKNVYFGVCPRSEKRGNETSICQVPVLWAELDGKNFKRGKEEALELLKRFEHKPSIIVDSGNGHHVYWLLKEPVEIESDGDRLRVKGYLKGLCEVLKGDHAFDLARVLRVPGTRNLKDPQNPKEVKTVSFHPDWRYTLLDFEDYKTEITEAKGKVVFSDSIPHISVDNLRVSERIKRLIREGWKPGGKYKSRSEADQAVIQAMVQAGYTGDEIRAVFTDPNLGISAKYLEKGKQGDQYLAHSIDKAKQVHAKAEQKPKAGKRKADRKLDNVIPVSFRKLPDDSLVEMCFDPFRSPDKFFARYDPRQKKVEYVSTITLEDGKTLAPYDDEMLDVGVVLLPSEAEDYGTERELLSEIQGFIHRYVAVGDFFEKLSVYYVLFTWIYDGFNVLPYLRVLGDYGTGKTRFLQTVGSLCYKPIFAGGATSPSPIFRVIHKYSGTFIFDEADFKSSEGYEEIVKILNCGHMRGFPVLRSLPWGRDFQTKAFDCFGPKIIAARHPWKDKALESRCLTETMDGKYREGVPIILPNCFWEEARKIRNKLLWFRFTHYGPRDIYESLRDSAIEPRLNQVVMPLASVISNQRVQEELQGFIREYNQEIITDRGMLIEADVVAAILRLYENNSNGRIKVKEITEEVRGRRGNDEKPITPHLVSWLLRKRLQLRTHRSRDGAYIVYDEEKLKALTKRYGIEDDLNVSL